MNNKDILKLTGTGREIGRKLGMRFKKNLKETPNVPVQKDRLRKFTAIIEETAPWWLEEVSGMAESADVKPEEILMRNCLPAKPGKYYLGGCTSFLIMGNRSKNGYPLLLKIRDEKPLFQIAGIKGISGTHRYIFGTNIDNLGIAHFLNEKGLAGANNTGSPVISGISDLGFNDCHIMRLVAEKAKNCEQALELIEKWIAKGYVGNGGYKRGMIFLFADPRKGLVIENTAEKIDYRFVNKGIFIYTNHFLLGEMKSVIDGKRATEVPSVSSRIRRRRGKELIGKMKNAKVGIGDLKRISRDTGNFPYSICNSSDTFPWRTVSAFIHSVDLHKRRSFVSNRAPVDTEYISLSVNGNVTKGCSPER